MPAAPQALVKPPSWQVPPAAPVQQPALHGCVESHDALHVLYALHAVCAGQSALVLQPQEPFKQNGPLGLAAQFAQAPPVDPQLAFDWAVWHCPPEQQPPLHSCDAEQAVVHCLVPRSHAFPAGQSDALVQPQAPFTQA